MGFSTGPHGSVMLDNAKPEPGTCQRCRFKKRDDCHEGSVQVASISWVHCPNDSKRELIDQANRMTGC